MRKRSLASIHPDAKIAENVTIDPFAVIDKDVEIGEGTWIGPHAVIKDGARIGRNCSIFPGAVISAIPQDLKFDGEKTTVEIGDSTTIREYCTINRGTKAKGVTIIGKNSLIMAYVHVAHDCLIGNHVILVNAVTLGGEVNIDDWAIVSGGTLVHQFCNIGKHVMVSGGSKVGRDVPPFITAAHDPLAYAGLNSIGLKRKNFGNGKINEIQDIYRVLFQKGLNTSNALKVIESEFKPSPERDEITNFVKNSKRGLIKGYTNGNRDNSY